MLHLEINYNLGISTKGDKRLELSSVIIVILNRFKEDYPRKPKITETHKTLQIIPISEQSSYQLVNNLYKISKKPCNTKNGI